MNDDSGNVRFALLGHPADYDHFVALTGDPKGSIGQRLNRHRATFSKLIEWAPSYVTHHRPAVALRNGIIEGRLIVCPFLPEKIKIPRHYKHAYEKVVAGCELAKMMGAKVVSLGGFTSILEGAHGNSLAPRLGLTITSGNSLTVALAVAQLRAVLKGAGRSIEEETVAVLGATGDIGRVCTLILAKSAKRIVLVARNRSRLEMLCAEIGSRLPIEIGCRPQAALSATVIVAAAGGLSPILDESELRPGTVVCDVGYPKNLSEQPSARGDTLIFSGGIAKLPGPIDLVSYLGLPAQDLLYGCFCEGLILAARPENVCLATSQGHAEVDRANALFAAAIELGIEPAPPYRGTRLIQRQEIINVARNLVSPT